MLRVPVLLLMVCLAARLAFGADPNTAEAEKKAVAAADAWLPIVDQEKYGEAWDLAAVYLKNIVGRDALVKGLEGVRKPLGAVKSRKLKSKEYRTTLPGAPDGQYVVIQYETSLEHKESAIETITPMLDKDGVWRVSGYFIR